MIKVVEAIRHSQFISHIDKVDWNIFVVLLRFAVGTLIVLVVAFPIALPNPYWGILTVAFIGLVSNVGQLWAKSVARLVGTIAGAAMGLVLLLLFSQSPIPLILTLTLWITLCAAFTSRYQAMAGYAGFLAALTAVLVVIMNIDQEDVYQWFYYAIYRASEISLGIFAIAISAKFVFPDAEHAVLRRKLWKFREDLDSLAEKAFLPHTCPSTDFIRLHEQACRDAIEINRQRYYSSLIERRLARISGHIQSVAFESLSVTAALVLVRRMRKADADAGVVESRKDHPVYRASLDRIHQNREKLDALIEALESREKLQELPTNRCDDSNLGARNLRDTLYRAATVFIAVSLSALVWLVSEVPNGGLLILSAAMLAYLRITMQKNRLKLQDIMLGIATCATWVFFIEYVVLIQVDSFWMFYGIYVFAYAVILACAYRNQTSIFWLICLLFFTILLPVKNIMGYDALYLINSLLLFVAGFFIAYLCIESIGSPSPKRLVRDHLKHIQGDMEELLTSPENVAFKKYRQRMLGYYLDTLYLDKRSKPEIIISWFNALSNIGACLLRLHQDQDKITETSEDILARAKRLTAHLCKHVIYPGMSEEAFNQEQLDELEQLFDLAKTNLQKDESSINLWLFILTDSLRRYYLLTHYQSLEELPI